MRSTNLSIGARVVFSYPCDVDLLCFCVDNNFFGITAGGAVPALAQLVSSSYHAAMSSPPSEDDKIQKSRTSSTLWVYIYLIYNEFLPL